MAIHMPGYYQNDMGEMQRQYGLREAVSQENPERNIQSEAQIRSLTPGQAINGEIIARDGLEVQLQVGRGIVLTARMDQAIQTPVGQTVTFEVRSNSGGTLALRPLFENLAQETTAGKALLAAGLGNDARSMQMVMSMMHEGMSIDRESLQEMNRQVMNMPDGDINAMVQMNRLQIPVTPENLAQFQAYKNYEHQLLSSFADIFEQIPQAVTDIFQGEGNSQGTAWINQLLQIFDSAGEGVLEKEPLSESAESEKGEQAAETLENITIRESGHKAMEDGAAGTVSEKTEGILTGGNLEKEILEKGILEKENRTGELGEKGNDRIVIEGQEVRSQEVHSDLSDQAIPGADLAKMGEIYGKAGGNLEIASQIAQGSISAQELYQAVRELGRHADTPEKQEHFRELFLSKGFQKIFQNRVSDNWLLRPEDVGKEGVARLYERLNEQTRQIMSGLGNALKADSPLMKTVMQIQENVEFMNQINQMYTYVQLPLRFRGENAHGDLYVYTNKKNLARREGNISAFLHLDMEHLGTVNVRVAMEKNRISTNFYLADEKSLDLIAENMELLTSRLRDKGYDVTASASLEEQEKNVMEEILATDKNIGMLSELSFDVRA